MKRSFHENNLFYKFHTFVADNMNSSRPLVCEAVQIHPTYLRCQTIRRIMGQANKKKTTLIGRPS